MKIIMIDRCMIIPKTHIPKATLWDKGRNNGFIYVLKCIKAIENVPNVLKAIRLLNSFLKVLKCRKSFNNTKNTKTVPIIKNILLKSVNIFPSEKIANIKPVIARGKFFIRFIILVLKKSLIKFCQYDKMEKR